MFYNVVQLRTALVVTPSRPSLHRDGGRSPICGLPRPKHGRLRVLPVAGVPAHAAAEGDPRSEAFQTGCRETRRLSEPTGNSHQADRLGTHSPAIHQMVK